MRFHAHKSCTGLLLAASAGLAAGQSNTTSFAGAVTDGTGARVPGTTVTLLNAATGAKETLDTNHQGEFTFPQAIPGHYTVTLHHEGFNDITTQLDLLISTPVTQNFKLNVGSTQTVEVVTASLPSSLNTTDATLGKAFNNLQIQTLPYLANNTLSLLALQPGVVSFDAANTTDTRAGTINGARQDQTNVTLDGVDNNDANFGYAFTGVLRATRDSVEEFRVVTSGANADAGRSSGAQVSLQTKSGTNKLRGSAYYYYRDPAAASNNWFNKRAQLNSGRPNVAAKVLQHTFGGSLGFPLLHDRLFFFGAYEGFKQASNQVVSTTVPLGSGSTADYGVAPGLRNGTLSYTNASGGTTTLTPAQIASMDRKCAASGSCPQGSGVSAAAIAYMRQFPISNAGGGDGINTGSYTFPSPAPISQITNIARVDYQISPRQTLFVRANLQSDNSATPLVVPGGVPQSNVYGNNRGIAAGHIWSLSDHLINNARYGWTRYGNASIGGVTQDYVTFAAFNSLFPTTTSTTVLENTHNFVDDFTIVKGRHTIQVGTNQRLIYDHRTLTNTLYKSATATTSYLAIGGIANTGSSLDPKAFNLPQVRSNFNSSYNSAVASVTGLITYAQQYVNYAVSGNSLSPLPAGTVPTRTFENLEQEYYVQDQWKATPKLTFTAGLRYAYLAAPFENNGQQVKPTTSLHNFLETRINSMRQGVTYQPAISLAPAGKANNAAGYWTPQNLNFAPRLAFNYSPDGKTSIRGGFMLAFDHFGTAAVDNFNDNGYSFGLSSRYAAGVGQNVDTAPRFSALNTVPTSIIPSPSAGGAFPVTPPITGNNSITQSFDDSLKTPYAEVFNLSFQRDIRKNFTVTATYTGRLGRHLFLLNDIAMPANLADPSSGVDYFGAMTYLDKLYDNGASIANVPNLPYWQNYFPNATFTSGGVTYKGTKAVYGLLGQGNRGNETAVLQLLDESAVGGGPKYRYFDPQYASLYVQSTIGMSNYNGAQLSLRHAITSGFIYDLNYTFAKSLDMGSSPERSSSNTIINTFDPRSMYAASDYDARHQLNADWTIILPYGHGQHWGGSANTLMQELLGGWTLAGLVKYESGLPFSAINNVGWGTNWSNRSYQVQTAPIPNRRTSHFPERCSGNRCSPFSFRLLRSTCRGIRSNTHRLCW